MALKNQYLIDLLETVKKRNAGEPEFIQAVTEVFESLQPVVEKRQDLVDAGDTLSGCFLQWGYDL